MRLHSGDSLGTGAAAAASVAAHAHRMPCRLSGRPSKAHLSLRPQFNFPSSHPLSIRSRLTPLADIGRSAVGCVEPGAEAACLFYGTPGMSHAKRYADKGVANEGWDPKNRQPRSDRLPPYLPPFCDAVHCAHARLLWYNAGNFREKGAGRWQARRSRWRTAH